MILSKKHKFIFIKGRKVASTSIEVMLASICGNNDIITPITPIDEQFRLKAYSIGAQNFGLDTVELENYKTNILSCSNSELELVQLPKSDSYFNHMSLQQLLSIDTYIDDSWFIFSFERNPYSKIISFANMQLSYAEYLSSGKAMKSSIKQLRRQIDMNFEDKTLITAVKNIDLYKDHTGAIRTTVYKYENLDSDIQKAMTHLNIKKTPKLGYFKKGLLSNSIDPQEVFTRDQIYTINELYSEEFDCFKYPFID